MGQSPYDAPITTYPSFYFLLDYALVNFERR